MSSSANNIDSHYLRYALLFFSEPGDDPPRIRAVLFSSMASLTAFHLLYATRTPALKDNLAALQVTYVHDAIY